MKNTLTLFAGIVFLLAILVAGCCRQQDDKEQKKRCSEEVNIWVTSVVEIKGEKHLMMSDSNGNSNIDTLFVTDVHPGQKVIWTKDSAEVVKKFLNMKARINKNIFKRNPHKAILRDEYRMRVPKKAKKDGEEKYSIEFKLKDNSRHETDPYLRIPN
jgi:ERCC4-type nuclease